MKRFLLFDLEPNMFYCEFIFYIVIEIYTFTAENLSELLASCKFGCKCTCSCQK